MLLLLRLSSCFGPVLDSLLEAFLSKLERCSSILNACEFGRFPFLSRTSKFRLQMREGLAPGPRVAWQLLGGRIC